MVVHRLLARVEDPTPKRSYHSPLQDFDLSLAELRQLANAVFRRPEETQGSYLGRDLWITHRAAELDQIK